LNVIWFVFAGLWLFIGYAFAALICFVLIITIPFGVASLRIALYGVWPFGRAVVPQAGKGIGSTIGNVIWFFVAGWWLTLLHIATGVLLCLTIIGIPLGLANFKLITVGLRPFGREIVSMEEQRRRGLPGRQRPPDGLAVLDGHGTNAKWPSWSDGPTHTRSFLRFSTRR
jgi:uncharacterized membrane protein YccF (DUF307 family)